MSFFPEGEYTFSRVTLATHRSNEGMRKLGVGWVVGSGVETICREFDCTHDQAIPQIGGDSRSVAARRQEDSRVSDPWRLKSWGHLPEATLQSPPPRFDPLY